ncbi:hypothetical protein FS837_010521 [Tulasnella sp. UAMH 9824]|nr:hypothetical protein FS837_010521 [Tulasnella sp. UAMH 9824]
MQSIAFVDAAAGVLAPSKSPVFDFDDVWADHVLALRNTAKASLGDAGWPILPMEGVSPTAMHHLGVKPEEYSQAAVAGIPTTTAHWSSTFGSTGAPVALNPQFGGVDSWTTTTTASSASEYGAMFPTTFGGYMMPIDQTSSTASVSTLESPRSSRGSKRPPSTDDDEDEDSPLEFASSKAKRPRFDVNPSSSYKSSASSNGVAIASAAPANNAVFILNNTSSSKKSAANKTTPHMSLDGLDVEGFWETVQGPWELADIPPPPPSHHTNAFFPVRAMPPLQVPVPRLPQQIWSAAAALGSTSQ